MSDLSSRGGCGCSTGCGCSNSCGCSGFGGNSCSWIWIILLLCCCCGNGNGFLGNNGCGCDNGCGCGGSDNSCLWIILLLCCCGGLVPTTVVADAITPVAVAIPADAKSESGVSSQGPLLCPGCQIF
ncbi:MAG: hypothetical protein ACLTI1_04305 [Clostridia bacterium]